MEEIKQKKPILVVTSDKWSRDSYVVFEDDEIIGVCIPDGWVDEAYSELLENYSQGELASNTPDDDAMPTREQVAGGMEDDFFAENSDVDEFWPEHHILRTGNDYYEYDDDGMCKYIDEDDALELMRMKKIEAAEMIEEIAEEMCIEHLGYTPCIWYTGGPGHNDDRLVAKIQDGKIIVSDGNAVEPYTGALTGEAIREYVSGWLHTLWGD